MHRLIKTVFCFLLLVGGANCALAQFAPAAGLSGSTALWRDSSIFVAWATASTVQRGYADVALPDSGYTTVGDITSAAGNAGTNGVVSLGDGGIATLTFAQPIYSGPGFDFAVFENGFPTAEQGMAFLEFAFVEVSSDGVNFVRFPAVSHIQDSAQLAMVGIDCSQVNNLAGKYVNGYGTPFDLEELKDEPGLDVNNITHVRVVDVVGSINPTYASYDSEGNKVNDPYPTRFPSGGFDLDAVGVIHEVGLTAISDFGFEISDFKVKLYPNPVEGSDVKLDVSGNLIGGTVTLLNIQGELLYNNELLTANCILPTTYLPSGVYFVRVSTSTGNSVSRIVKQ